MNWLSTTTPLNFKRDSNDEIFAFDLESNGLYDDVTEIFCIVIHDLKRNKTFTYGPDCIDDALAHLDSADTLIGHNIIFYDCSVIEKLYPDTVKFNEKKLIDTLVCSRLIWPKEKLYEEDDLRYQNVPQKLKGSSSLKAWGYRLSDHKIDFKDFGQYSEEMAAYCRQDVAVTIKLFDLITQQNCASNALTLEHSLARCIERQIRSGFPFDLDAALDLVDKLTARKNEIENHLQEAFPPKIISEPFTPRVNNAARGYVKGQPMVRTREEKFNPGSRQQICDRLKEKYGWTPGKFTDKGNPVLDDDVLEKLSYPEAKYLAEYMLIKKRLGQIKDGSNAWLKLVDADSLIHGNLNTNGCITGRCSHCIEENQRVTQPKGLVPIKDVKPGDYVYSYDDDLNLQLNKVVEVIDQGMQECYALRWHTNFEGKKGELICTANHKIFTKKGWKRLAEISVGEKINHLAVTISHTEQRKVLHMVKKQKRQCTFIKENLFNKKGKAWHIHHIDKNKMNDDIANLKLMSASEHSKLHGEEDKWNEIQKNKFSLLRMIAKAKGHPTRVDMDFNTFKSKCKKYNIDLSLVLARYSKVTEKYITKRQVLHALEQGWSPYRIGKEYKITWNKARIDKLLESHGIVNNHWVYEIEYIGIRQTYDLHVENNHNFICEELCVSNSNPNMAQIPASYSPYGKECRSLFHAPQGWDLIGVDAKALELRCLAGYLAIWDQGEYASLVVDPEVDIHTHNQQMFGVPTRDIAKRLLYGIAYGAGSLKAGTIVDPNEKDEAVLRKLGSTAINSFMRGVPALEKLKTSLGDTILNRGYLIGLDKRPLYCRSEYKALNVLLQAAGAVLMKQVVINLHRNMEAAGFEYGVHWKQHAFIHDEIQLSCQPHLTETVVNLALKAFPEAGDYFKFRCPIEGDANTGRTWADTH